MNGHGNFSGIEGWARFSTDPQKLHDEIRSRMDFVNLSEVSGFASVVVRILAEQQRELNQLRDRVRELEVLQSEHGR